MITRKRQSGKMRAFTIVELLTVMSVIIILIGLLVPALNQVKRYAKEVKQRAQFHSIDVAMEMFETIFEGYPDSRKEDSEDEEYCGAMKLAEAMVGQDLLGLHKDSMFRADFQDALGSRKLYQEPGATDIDAEDLKKRMSPYLQLDNANAVRLEPYTNITSGIDDPGIWKENDIVTFANEHTFVLCDVYKRQMTSGYKTGMPILYYKANINGNMNPNSRDSSANATTTNEADRFYRHEDNDDLVTQVNSWSGATQTHPIGSDYVVTATSPWPVLKESFYWKINNDSIPIRDGRPYKNDSYILLSAGFDGLYGTSDDIFNFQN